MSLAFRGGHSAWVALDGNGDRVHRSSMHANISPSWILTDERLECREGRTVLVHRIDNVAYGPADMLDLPEGLGGMQPAGDFVEEYAHMLSGNALDLARRFLAQDPKGPHL